MAKKRPSPRRRKAAAIDLARLEPHEFFEELLVERYAEGVARFGAPPGTRLEVRVELTGSGGGVWELDFDERELGVKRRDSGRDVDVHVFQSVADWKALLRGELGGPTAVLSRVAPEPPPVVPLDTASRERLRKLRGTLAFVIRHFQDRDWKLGFHFGPGPLRDPPDTVFSMGATDFQSLGADGRTPNLQALMFGGGLRIEGDFAIAGELAAIAATHAQALLATRR